MVIWIGGATAIGTIVSFIENTQVLIFGLSTVLFVISIFFYSKIKIMSNENHIIENVLNQNRTYLGKHFDTYKNHVYRVFNLCQKLDHNQDNIEKYAIASVFHDLGIWTDKTFDYLDPSISLARKHLKESNKLQWIEEISLMIDMHHKRSKYKGNFKKTVENFRRADWIDVTKGRMNFNMNKEEIEKITKEYPLLGFHKFLFLQTLRQFLKSPLNPLPMFKK